VSDLNSSYPADKPRTGRALKSQAAAPTDSPDMTLAEVAAFRREGESTVWRKIRAGTYVSFKSGDKRLITRESVLADRERCLAAGPRLSTSPTGGRRAGRPKTKAGAEA
jgi:hypothetical protein